MKFSYNWLQSYFKDKPASSAGKLPEPKKLADVLTMRSFEVESVLKFGKDYILDIKVLANRMSDCSSHLGIARECAALLNYGLRITDYGLRENSKLLTKDYVKIEVLEKEMCPRYTALLIRGVKIKQSPKWLVDRLASIGQKSINNVVDATNYAMLEVGQPLHAFDLEKLGGRKIIVRRAMEEEKITTLDNRSFVLSPQTLVIADEKEPLAIAGIKGGKKAEVDEKTKDILIEAAVFEPAAIRRTSRMINLKTDASLRFEHGVSLFLPEIALKRVSQLVKEIAGGEISAQYIDLCSRRPRQNSVLVKEEDIYKLLGERIMLAEAQAILTSLGFEISRKNGKSFLATAPVERLDITTKEDAIEEIGRVYGYEKIISVIPEESLISPAQNDEYFYSEMLKNIFVGLGFSEAYNYSLVRGEDDRLKLENSISPDRAFLRKDLISSLKQNICDNFRYFDVVRLFEIGKVFRASGEGILEETKIAAAIGYKTFKKSEERKRELEIVFELKGVAETLLNKLGITDARFIQKENDNNDNNNHNNHKLAEIAVNDIVLGFITTESFEMDLQKIIELAEEDYAFRPISKYPAVTRDLAVFMPLNTKVEEVVDVIENTGGELLVDSDLFDMYEPEDGMKKSLAFHLIFQSDKKTLTDEEVNELVNKIIKVLEENLEWEVRKG
ncbi:MAG: phenylalanine--tRNA ligase subunit beta [bacterium]|nr:phenylalanine--tRNA ligase subunit beta [bacterium]